MMWYAMGMSNENIDNEWQWKYRIELGYNSWISRTGDFGTFFENSSKKNNKYTIVESFPLTFQLHPQNMEQIPAHPRLVIYRILTVSLEYMLG